MLVYKYRVGGKFKNGGLGVGTKNQKVYTIKCRLCNYNNYFMRWRCQSICCLHISTPDGDRATRLKTLWKKQKVVKFKIVERGGVTLGNILQNSNPTASKECKKEDCYMDNQPKEGKMCHK